MCEHAQKLVAWLDRELDTNEALAVELHLQGCQTCRGQLAAYQQVSDTFNDYCAALPTARGQRPKRRGVPLWAAAAAVLLLATVGVLFHGVPRKITVTPNVRALVPQPALSGQVASRPTLEVLSTPAKSIRNRHARRAAAKKTDKWIALEPSIEVAIPADAVFPPGAVPEGVSFTAVVNIGPDGLVQPINFHPSMYRIEGRTNQP